MGSTANSVLRRLLLPEAEPESSPSRTASRQRPPSFVEGKLIKLVRAGVIQPGDKLVHEQVRRETCSPARLMRRVGHHRNQGRYRAPSPALAELVESQIDGWHRWVHAPSGKTLRQLREELKGSSSST